MDRPFFEQQAAAVRAAFAGGLGCEAEVLERDELTFVDRPDAAPWPFVTMVATFGVGMVVSVDPAYREFVRAAELEKPEAAAWPTFLGTIASEVKRRGVDEVSAGPIALLWALSERPPAPAVPGELELRQLDAAWMLDEVPNGRFPNALGPSDERARGERNRFAWALVAEDGEPVAVAGVLDTLGLHEIGVDVVPSHQARGLAPIVVAAAARAIIEDGGTPLYACAATNIRSQRTAFASGFVPVGADAFVS